MSVRSLLSRLGRAETGSRGGWCRCPIPPGGGAWDAGGLFLPGDAGLRALCPTCGGSYRVEVIERVVPASEPEPSA